MAEKEGENKDLVDVNHTFIDFRHLILGQKMALFDKGKVEKFIFDDFQLAVMMNNLVGKDSVF